MQCIVSAYFHQIALNVSVCNRVVFLRKHILVEFFVVSLGIPLPCALVFCPPLAHSFLSPAVFIKTREFFLSYSRFCSCPWATVFELKEKARDHILRKHCTTTRNYYMISVFSLKGRPEVFSHFFFLLNYCTLNLSWDLK